MLGDWAVELGLPLTFQLQNVPSRRGTVQEAPVSNWTVLIFISDDLQPQTQGTRLAATKHTGIRVCATAWIRAPSLDMPQGLALSMAAA